MNSQPEIDTTEPSRCSIYVPSSKTITRNFQPSELFETMEKANDAMGNGWSTAKVNKIDFTKGNDKFERLRTRSGNRFSKKLALTFDGRD